MTTELHRAAKGGDTPEVKRLVEKGEFDLNQGDNLGRTPFYLACREGHEEIVRFLMDHGKADITKKTLWDVTPLAAALACDHFDVARMLRADDRTPESNPDPAGDSKK
mmetsp:Transcript_28842/g.80579  ORF Transcript_28842/g.80579 Transcript_28842/m.80579 type:complete len:108 (-) Transcript_28842:612-935(-)